MKHSYWVQYRRVHSLEWLVNDIAACVPNKKFMEESGCNKDKTKFKRATMLKEYYPEKVDAACGMQNSLRNNLVCGVNDSKLNDRENVIDTDGKRDDSKAIKLWKDILKNDSDFEDVKKRIQEKLEGFSNDELNIIINEVIKKRFFAGSLFYLKSVYDERESAEYYGLYYLKDGFFDLIDEENGVLKEVTPVQIFRCNNEDFWEKEVKVIFPPIPKFCMATKASRGDVSAYQSFSEQFERIQQDIEKLKEESLSRDSRKELKYLEKYCDKWKPSVSGEKESLYEFLRRTLNGIYKNQKYWNVKNNIIEIVDNIDDTSDWSNGKYKRDYAYLMDKKPVDAIVIAFLFAMSISIIGREDYSAEDESYIFYKLFHVSETEKLEFQKDLKDGYVATKDVLCGIAMDVVFAAKHSDFDLLYSMLCKLFDVQKDFFKSSNKLCYLNYFWVKYFVEIKQKCKQDNIIDAEFENCTKYDLLKNCFGYCCSQEHMFDKYYKMQEYLGLACAEYAAMIYRDAISEEYPNLTKIIQKAKELGCTANFLFELEADLLVDKDKILGKRSTEDFENAYMKYRVLYASTQQENLIEKIIICLKKAKGMKDEYGKPYVERIGTWDIDKLLEVWETAKLKIAGDQDSIQREIIKAFEDKAKELKKKVDNRRFFKQQQLFVDIEKDEYSGQSNRIFAEELAVTNDVSAVKEDANTTLNVNDKVKDLNEDNGIYVLFGVRGKATEHFLKSTVDRTNANFIVVLQNHEKLEDALYIQRMLDMNFYIFDKGYKNIFGEEALELFDLDNKLQDDEDIFDNFKARKIHFLLLGENKSENLSFAMEIIQRACEKHYVYKRYFELTRDRTEKYFTGNGIDFQALVDIKLDTDTRISEWYLDSLMSRYDDEFYLPISYVSYEKEAVKELLTEYPIFLADSMGKEILKPRYNVVILGGNEISYELVKNILAVSVFQRLDLVDASIKDAVKKGEYDAFEKTVCGDFTLTVIDKNASSIENKLHRDAPDFFRNRSYLHCVPHFYDLDVESYEIVDLFRMFDVPMKSEQDESLSSMYGVLCDDAKRNREISKVLLNGDYFVCTLDNDEHSLHMGMLIRELAYRQDDSFSHEPVISVLCKEGILDANVNEFSIGDESYTDAWFRNYHINQFGGYQRIFSYDTLYDNFVDHISRELHCGGKDGEGRKEKMRQYFRSSYNRISCDARALHIPYMFYSVLGEMMRHDYSLNYSNNSYEGFVDRKSWSMSVFKESIETYIEKYNEIIHQEDVETLHSDNVIAEMMSILEHNRWLVFMALQGYTSVPYGNDEFNETKKAYITGWASRMTGVQKASKLNIAKIHPVMVPYAKLGEKERINNDAIKQDALNGELKKLCQKLETAYSQFVNEYYTRRVLSEQNISEITSDRSKETKINDLYKQWKKRERGFRNKNTQGEGRKTFIDGYEIFSNLWTQIVGLETKYKFKQIDDFDKCMQQVLSDFNDLQNNLERLFKESNWKPIVGLLGKCNKIQEMTSKLSMAYESVIALSSGNVVQEGEMKQWFRVAITNPRIKLDEQVKGLENLSAEYKELIQNIIVMSNSALRESEMVYKADGLEKCLIEVAKISKIRVSSKSNRYYNREFVKGMADVLSKIKERGIEESISEIREKPYNSQEVKKVKIREER